MTGNNTTRKEKVATTVRRSWSLLEADHPYWRFWVGALLMASALAIYVFSHLAWAPGPAALTVDSLGRCRGKDPMRFPGCCIRGVETTADARFDVHVFRGQALLDELLHCGDELIRVEWLDDPPVAPALRPSSFLAGSDSVVSIRMGVKPYPASLRIPEIIWIPSMLGMLRSVMTRSNFCAGGFHQAIFAIHCAFHFKTQLGQGEGQHCRMLAESSTVKIRFIVRSQVPCNRKSIQS